MINMYAIYDDVAKVYTQPIFCGTSEDEDINDEIALRVFLTQLKTDGSLLSMYPEDYNLYHLGVYDDVDGTFVTFESNRFIYNGRDYLEYWNEYLKPVVKEISDNVEK